MEVAIRPNTIGLTTRGVAVAMAQLLVDVLVSRVLVEDGVVPAPAGARVVEVAGALEGCGKLFDLGDVYLGAGGERSV